MNMKQFGEENCKGYRGALMGVFDPGHDAETIFGKQYNESFYATACAYLLRRFGPAQWGCDSYKDLVQYYLTTGMEGVVLTVRPCCSVSTSFGYLLRKDLYESTSKADVEARGGDIMKCKIRRPVVMALYDAMQELKKPVNVRDWYFNIVSRVKDCDLEFTEDGDSVLCVDYSNLAGFGITRDYFDKFKSKEK